MSKTPYTIDVDRYICYELELIRKMLETYDFSSLKAVVERIQHHATSMEDALYTYNDVRYTIRGHVDNEETSDAEFRDKVRRALNNMDEQ